tara:strand:- start:2012 stop:2167 length:156 start_codon:yes stop_codon:yes gene_type:complete
MKSLPVGMIDFAVVALAPQNTQQKIHFGKFNTMTSQVLRGQKPLRRSSHHI